MVQTCGVECEGLRRLGEIKKETHAEVSQVAASQAHWQELDREFQSMIRAFE